MFAVSLGEVLVAVVLVVVLVALVLVIASVVRRGPDEASTPVEPAAVTAEQLLPAEPRTVEERLAEIDSLHAKGAITDDERDEARARIITSM